MRRRLLATAGLLSIGLAFSTPAVSQSAAPDAVAAANELITTMRLVDQAKRLTPIILQGLKPVITQGRPEVAQEFDRLAPTMVETFTERIGELVALLATLYAQNFTANELNQVTAFYRTPTGQKFLEKMPALTQESMALGQRFGEKLGPELQSRMIEELRKKGHKI